MLCGECVNQIHARCAGVKDVTARLTDDFVCGSCNDHAEFTSKKTH